jgi:glucose/mannose transport system permease protein
MSLPRKPLRLAPYLALAPGAMVFVGVFIGCTLLSFVLSFTDTRMFPSYNFVGLMQYELLFSNSRWNQTTVNIAIYGPLFVSISIVLGIVLAIAVDQKVRMEGTIRTFILYPHATSFIVTGLLWRWFFDPSYGLDSVLANVGLPETGIEWLSDPDMVIYSLVVAGVWHSAGLVMVIMLSGLRGIDTEIWKAARVDGIPTWRTYVSIVLPMLTGALATCLVLLSISVVKVYDLVVAMTNGGPGFASDMPAKFVMDNLFERQNAGLASAGVMVMLLTVAIIFAPLAYARSMRGRYGRKPA